MNSIAQTNPSEKQLSEKMQYFLRRYHVSRILRAANAYKLHDLAPVCHSFISTIVALRLYIRRYSSYFLLPYCTGSSATLSVSCC